VLSLHVLVGPKHHALQHGWVRDMRALDPELKRKIEAYAFLYRRQVPDLLLPSPRGRSSEWGDELERVRSWSPELLLAAFGRPLYDHGGTARPSTYGRPRVRKAALERARADGEEAAALAEELLDDPVRFTDGFLDVLDLYWRAAFSAEWTRVESVLSESIVEAGHVLATAGIWPVLGRLPGHCRAEPVRSQLLIDLPHEHDVVICDANPLLLVPSVFVWPHLRVNCDPPWPTALVYAAPPLVREAEPRIPPSELLRVLRALADDTRLRVLKLIAERPRTTQELAPLVGLSNAGLSKSLQRLGEAGLITSRRQGYYVVYSLQRGRLAGVPEALARFLEPG